MHIESSLSAAVVIVHLLVGLILTDVVVVCVATHGSWLDIWASYWDGTVDFEQ